MNEAALFAIGGVLGIVGAVLLAGLLVVVFGDGKSHTGNAIVDNAEELSALSERMRKERESVRHQ